MKIDLENLSNLEKKLNIDVPLEKVTAAFERIYKQIQKQAELKGFRKGKAPLDVIRSKYAEQARQDALNELIQEHYIKGLEEHSLDPISHPAINIDSFGEKEGLKFTAQFEIRPDIKLQNYKGLNAQKEKFVFDESHVDNVIENIRSNQAEMVPVLEDRGAQMGDVAIIDFEGTMNGAPLENAQGTQHNLELGSSNFIPGFEEGIEGMKPGSEKTLDLKFPDEYHAEQLAGNPVTFKVTLKELKKKSLPEFNDEFAKKIGYDSAEDLRAAIKDDYTKQEENRIQEDFKNRLLKVLVDANPVDVPKTLFESQKNALIEDVHKRMEAQGMTHADFQDYVKKWDEDFNKSANFMIQSGFLINTIAHQENLVATDADIQAKVAEYAAQAGLEMDKLKDFYGKEENQQRLASKLTEDKVVAFLEESANITEVAKDQLKDAE